MHLSIFAKVMGIVLIWKWLFVTTVISQGSAATRLRCGGQCDSQFVANFLLNSTMEKFRKSINICQSYGQNFKSIEVPFLTHSVCMCCWRLHAWNPGLSPFELAKPNQCIFGQGAPVLRKSLAKIHQGVLQISWKQHDRRTDGRTD